MRNILIVIAIISIISMSIDLSSLIGKKNVKTRIVYQITYVVHYSKETTDTAKVYSDEKMYLKSYNNLSRIMSESGNLLVESTIPIEVIDYRPTNVKIVDGE